MNLLFLNAGRRCELLRAFRQALNREGGGLIHASDISDLAPALAVADRQVILPHSSAPDFVAALADWCHRHDIDVVIPTIDPDLEWLDRRRREIAAACPNLRLLLAPAACIAVARNKRATRDRFAALGAAVPEPVDATLPDPPFPLFAKPPDGSAGAGCRVLRNPVDLEACRRDQPNAMIERFVDGPEYTVDVLCDLVGQALCAVPRRRLKIRGGEVAQGVVERLPQLERLAMSLAEGCGCTGPVTLQFRRPAANRFVAMELNARMGGGLPLSIAAGADWPRWILQLLAGQEPDVDVPLRDGLRLSRYDTSLFLPPPPPAPAASPLENVEALIFDLDDTLYPERDFVFSGYRAVAERVMADHGIDIEGALRARFNAGERGDLFTTVMLDLGLPVSESYVRGLVRVYRGHRPSLRPCLDTRVLGDLRRAGFRLGLLSDGHGGVQRRKLGALGLAPLFDSVVFSDDLGGRETWKPSPLPYRACLAELDTAPAHAVYVGDNPAKDFLGARAAGMRSIRLRRPDTEHAAAEPLDAKHAATTEVTSLMALRDLVTAPATAVLAAV